MEINLQAFEVQANEITEVSGASEKYDCVVFLGAGGYPGAAYAKGAGGYPGAAYAAGAGGYPGAAY